MGVTNYVDPFSRLEAQNGDSVQMRGSVKVSSNADGDDDMIIVNSRMAKA